MATITGGLTGGEGKNLEQKVALVLSAKLLQFLQLLCLTRMKKLSTVERRARQRTLFFVVVF